jgi:hypothetical protein
MGIMVCDKCGKSIKAKYEQETENSTEHFRIVPCPECSQADYNRGFSAAIKKILDTFGEKVT